MSRKAVQCSCLACCLPQERLIPSLLSGSLRLGGTYSAAAWHAVSLCGGTHSSSLTDSLSLSFADINDELLRAAEVEEALLSGWVSDFCQQNIHTGSHAHTSPPPRAVESPRVCMRVLSFSMCVPLQRVSLESLESLCLWEGHRPLSQVCIPPLRASLTGLLSPITILPHISHTPSTSLHRSHLPTFFSIYMSKGMQAATYPLPPSLRPPLGNASLRRSLPISTTSTRIPPLFDLMCPSIPQNARHADSK